MIKTIYTLIALMSTIVYGGIVREGLILEMDASEPGEQPDSYWRPVGKAEGGILRDCTDPAMENFSHKPFLIVEPALYSYPDVDGFIWYYRFTYSDPVDGVHDGGGGLVGNIGEGVIFDYYQDYTVEFWYRYSRSSSTTVDGKGWLFSADDGSGFRFNTRTTSDGAKYFFELVHIYKGYANSYNLAAGIPSRSFDNQWHHIVIVHNGTIDQMPYAIVYIDGVKVVDRQAACISNISLGGVCPPQWSTFNVLPNNNSESPAAIGGRCDYWLTYKPSQRFWWAGDLSVLRVYNAVLTEEQQLQNYSAGIVKDKGLYCGKTIGNLNNDCKVDLGDFAIICRNWLETNWQY